MNTPDTAIERDYVVAQRSFATLAAGLSDAEWATPVPCCPGWTARDVLSHVAGIPDDVLAGRVDGAATDPWTASQVDRNREMTVADLLAQWNDQTRVFAAAIQAMQEYRPPIDLQSHEHDVRHALGRPGNRDNDIITAAAHGTVAGWDGATPLVVEFDDGTVVGSMTGDSTVALRGITPFEFIRSITGRRTRQQVEAYDWVGGPDRIAAVIDDWFAFGPAQHPIIE